MPKKSLATLPIVVILAVIALWWQTSTTTNIDKPVRETKRVLAPKEDAPATTHIKKRASAAGNISKNDALTREFSHFVKKGKNLKTRPSSLQGTKVDGHVAADANGNLVISVGIREMFDYYLSTLGEENLASVKARIALYLEQRLPQKAALQAWDLLNRYLHYRKAMTHAGRVDANRSLTELRRTMKKRNALRKSILGQRVDQAFYGSEEAYDRYTLSRLKIERDEHLSNSEKQKKLDQLRDALPVKVKQMIKTTMAPLNAAQKVKTMRDQGASQAAIQAYRTRKFGAKAAERLKMLHARRETWKHRYRKYRKQRQTVVNADLAPNDRKQQISALRKRMFSPGEQKRVKALDDIASQTTDTSKKSSLQFR